MAVALRTPTTMASDAGPRVAAIVLAAGRGSRYAEATDGDVKLLAILDGMPLVRRVVETALTSSVSDVSVVTGYARDAVMAALEGLIVREVHNPSYAEGQSTSLRAGIAALGPDINGVVVLLADMPRVSVAVIDALVIAFREHPHACAVMPSHKGRRGNPVLLSRALFAAIDTLTGDEGARRLLKDVDVVTVQIDDDGILLDVDTPDALVGLR